MQQISSVKKVTYVKPWQGKEEALYFHEIVFENGEEGKLQGNNEESPAWLFVGSKIKYDITQGKFNTIKNKYDMNIKFLGTIRGNTETEQPNQTPQRKNTQAQAEQRQAYPSKFDSDPAFKLRQQKCISMTTCLDRANELVIAGKIELKEKEKYALDDFNFIMKHSGIEDMEKTSSDNSETGNPVLLSSTKQPALFEDEPLSEFLKEAISRCDTPKQLTALRGQLKENESSNKNVLTAIHNREQELKKKK